VKLVTKVKLVQSDHKDQLARKDLKGLLENKVNKVQKVYKVHQDIDSDVK
jgi:hypothetical protein